MERRTRAPPRKRKNVIGLVETPGAIKVAPFVVKLRAILQASDGEVAHWSDDGCSFSINEELAPSTIIPAHFSHSSWRSLLRQLSCYGFRKARRKKLGPSNTLRGWSEFAHEYFVRDSPDLMSKIKRMEHLSTPTSCDEDDCAPVVTDSENSKRVRTVSNDTEDCDDENFLSFPDRCELAGLAALGMAANHVLQKDVPAPPPLPPPPLPPPPHHHHLANPPHPSFFDPHMQSNKGIMLAELLRLRARVAELEFHLTHYPHC